LAKAAVATASCSGLAVKKPCPIPVMGVSPRYQRSPLLIFFQALEGGFFKLPHVKRKFNDWKRSGHGPVDVKDSIAQSCDVYFYDFRIYL
jgi:hypothetical protein